MVIVVALLGMLAFLGFVFYTFAKQERANAATFSLGAKILKAPSLEPDALFDFALQQAILGPPDGFTQSILWGGRHSLMANMYGRDGIPWNGEGVHLIPDPTLPGIPRVDMDFNGSPDASDAFLDPVDSPAANNGTIWGPGKSLAGLPAPDVNYNAPNIDTMFLSYDGIATDGGAPPLQKRVLIPSFLRPQYLRMNSGGTVAFIPDWCSRDGAGTITDPSTKAKSFRPHPSHICVDSSGNPLTILIGSTPTNIPRFVNANENYFKLGLRRPFSSNPSFNPVDSTGTVTNGNLGVWSNSANPITDINLDVDTDGDGVMDAILMDLGYPPIRRGDGKLVVPLFAISIRDLNGLLNVNAVGNLSGNLNLSDLSGAPQNQLGFRRTGINTFAPDNLSKSNLGLTTNEINLQRALTADPVSDANLGSGPIPQQIGYFLKSLNQSITASPPPPGRSIGELANIEWLVLNSGRPKFHLGFANSASTYAQLLNSVTEYITGRNGESTNANSLFGLIIAYDMTPGPTFGTPTFYPASHSSPEELPSCLPKFLAQLSPVSPFNLIPFNLPRAGLSVTWNTTATATTVVNVPAATGNPNADDNSNFNEGETSPSMRYAHPLDFRGAGQQFRRFGLGTDGVPGIPTYDDDSNGVIDDLSEEGMQGTVGGNTSDDPVTPLYGKTPELYTPTGTPFLWPMYSGYHSQGTVRWGDGSVATGNGNIYASKLMVGSRGDSLVDEGSEGIIDPILLSNNYSGFSALNSTLINDDVFGPQEIAFLQGTAADARLTSTSSRLSELMPANLSISQFASDIRKRLTTLSTDRREFGVGSSFIGSIRTWESTPQFPPGLNPAGTTDPYRNELFQLLQQQFGAGSSNWQFRLNVNRLLSLSGSQLQFRNLTAYDLTTYPAAPINNTANQDRQLMARDIYTLMYTLCQGTDADYRTAPISAELSREMAQFAVNLVDELDTDDVITAFPYDASLNNGWTAPGVGAPVVYGVERQLLAFSESLAFRVTNQSVNSKMTIFDDTLTDTTNGRRYVYFELQNVTPMNVALATSGATTAATATWRVSLENTTGVVKSSVYFLNGLSSLPSTALSLDSNSNRVLLPGKLFTVASQDGTDTITSGGTDYRTSDFRADTTSPLPTTGNDYERIVPAGGTPDTTIPDVSTSQTMFPIPACDLDLVWNKSGYPTNAFTTAPTTTPGAFAAALDGSTLSYRLVLERQASDGSWVAVDRTKTPPTSSPNVVVINPGTGVMDDASTVTAQLTNLVSTERKTPLSRTSESPNPATTLPICNSFMSANFDLLNPPKLWQHHNDRDFGTLAELFQIPLYGPDNLTEGRLGDREFVDRGNLDLINTTDLTYTSTTNPTLIPTIAAARFLNPNNPDQPSTVGNRWYRLLELLEVPNRAHQHPVIATQSALTTPPPALIAEPFNLPLGFGWPRTHGLINLNMIRHPQVLNALLDDDLLVNDPRFVAGATEFLDDATGETRQWWVQFLKARDSRFAPVSAFAADQLTNLYVPGTASGRPFRGNDIVGPVTTVDSPLEHTVLRSLPMDAATDPNQSRRLFEVGQAAEHFGSPANEALTSNVPLNPSVRYRLLSKLMNNTTTRSNSFAIYITVQYHEAAEVVATGGTAVRIGGRLEDTPTHRGFFVVDRTGAVEQMKRQPSNPVSVNSFSFTPDTNRTGTPNGIRWKDLVLFRQTLN